MPDQAPRENPPSPAKPAASPPPGGNHSSLDTLESSVEKSQIDSLFDAHPNELPPLSYSQIMTHGGWQPVRKKIHAALVRTGQTVARCNAFGDCASQTWFESYIEDETKIRARTNRCHDRLCTPCAQRRAWEIRDCLEKQMGTKSHLFITLTLSEKTGQLKPLIEKLYRSFRYLRAHPLWAEKIRGGAAFLEIKYNPKAKRWHPHLHVIADGDYIEQGFLTKVWHGLTKDAFIVHVKRTTNPAGQASYVTKYTTKPLSSTYFHAPDLLDEAIKALKGTRLCLTFGTWYGTPLTNAEDDLLEEDVADPFLWKGIGRLNDLVADALAGNATAAAFLENRIPKWAQKIGNYQADEDTS